MALKNPKIPTNWLRIEPGEYENKKHTISIRINYDDWHEEDDKGYIEVEILKRHDEEPQSKYFRDYKKMHKFVLAYMRKH